MRAMLGRPPGFLRYEFGTTNCTLAIPGADVDLQNLQRAKNVGGSSCWTYSAFPSLVLFNTQLPLLNKYVRNLAALPQPTHDAAWWEAKTKGFDFSDADRVNPEAFNRVIWEGMMGAKPYPTTRSGANLRHSGTPQPETKEVNRGDSE